MSTFASVLRRSGPAIGRARVRAGRIMRLSMKLRYLQLSYGPPGVGPLCATLFFATQLILPRSPSTLETQSLSSTLCLSASFSPLATPLGQADYRTSATCKKAIGFPAHPLKDMTTEGFGAYDASNCVERAPVLLDRVQGSGDSDRFHLSVPQAVRSAVPERFCV